MIDPTTKEELLAFRREREWEQFHTSKNLSIALCVEAAELAEIFQWTADRDMDATVLLRARDIRRELADVAILMTYLCHDLGVDLDECVREKIRENAGKYPVEKAKGSARKYDRLD